MKIAEKCVLLVAGKKLILGFCLTVLVTAGYGSELNVAVASNFRAPMQELALLFQAERGTKIAISSASSGKLYAQILHGAPYDAFFSGDSSRALKLVQQGLAVPDSRFSYARGVLALWCPDSNGATLGPQWLTGQNARFAIANPRFAPFGLAARECLVNLGLWQTLEPQLVRGENIAQTGHFVRSGAAGAGFVALSLVPPDDRKQPERCWIPAEALYSPIVQQAVILRDGPEVREFFLWMTGDGVWQVLEQWGYRRP